MSRTHSKSARKYRTSAASRAPVANAAIRRPPRRVLRRFEVSVELGPSLLLAVEQAERLTEFQRWHVGNPALRLTDARSIVCPELDGEGRPLRTGKGQPLTIRIVLEVACSHNMRHARWSRRFRTLWHFAAWEETGHLAHMSTHRTRKAVLALFNRPAERLALSRDRLLVELPAPLSATAEGGRHE